MRSLNQCAQCAHGVSESVVHTARGGAGGGVSQERAGADGGTGANGGGQPDPRGRGAAHSRGQAKKSKSARQVCWSISVLDKTFFGIIL